MSYPYPCSTNTSASINDNFGRLRSTDGWNMSQNSADTRYVNTRKMNSRKQRRHMHRHRHRPSRRQRGWVIST